MEKRNILNYFGYQHFMLHNLKQLQWGVVNYEVSNTYGILVKTNFVKTPLPFCDEAMFHATMEVWE